MSEFPLTAVQAWVRRQRWAPAEASLELVELVPISVSEQLWLVFLRAGAAVVQVPLQFFPEGGNSAFTDASAHPLVAAQLLAWAGLDAPADLVVKPLGAEQSNTSVCLYSASWVGPRLLKLIRVLYPGQHPEAKICGALSAVDCQVVPHFHGFALQELAGSQYTLCVISDFVAGAVDAWEFFTAEVGEPGALGKSLGLATAQLHRNLATALPVTTRMPAAQLVARVEAEVASTPLPAALAAQLTARIAELSVQLPVDFPCQLIHGDYHLGQVLYQAHSDNPWQIVDFEGEPLRPLQERNLPDLALRDCAGMLRSFAYAEAVKFGMDGADGTWAQQAQEAFLTGYFASTDPVLAQAVLELLLLEKTCYEYRYEATFRPGWQWIPQVALERLAQSSA